MICQVEWGTDEAELNHKSSGNRTSYIGDYKDAVYVSGIFHHVKLEGLNAETKYYYRYSVAVLPQPGKACSLHQTL